MGEPPDWAKQKFEFDYVGDDYLDPEIVLRHGSEVFDLIAAIAPEATFSTYQVVEGVKEDGETKQEGDPWDLISAIEDSVKNGADILNLSVGLEQGCNGHCSVCREADLAVMEDDVCIVVATGNKENLDKVEGVHCPAVSDRVIGVGGFLSLCTNDPVRDDSSGQWWIENEDLIGPFCGQENCSDSTTCDSNCEDVLWQGNVKFHNAAPDTLAQVFYISGTSLDKIDIQPGTSYAAPVVTGLLTSILSDLAIAGVNPSAEEILAAVRKTGTEIDDAEYSKIDAQAVDSYLRTNSG